MSPDQADRSHASDPATDDADTSCWLTGLQPIPLVHRGPTPGEDIRDVLLVLIGVFVLPSIVAIVGVDLLGLVGVSESDTPVAYNASQYGFVFTGYLLVGLGYLAWRETPELVGIRRPTIQDLSTIVGGFLALVLVMFAVESIINHLGIQTAANEAIEQGSEHPELFLALIPIQFLFTAPAEELIFRGVFQGLLRRTGGVLLGIVGSALIFALFHLPALAGSETVPLVATVSIIFISGLFLAGLYEYTGTLVVPIVVHALWNTLLFSMEYSAVTQTVPLG